MCSQVLERVSRKYCCWRFSCFVFNLSQLWAQSGVSTADSSYSSAAVSQSCSDHCTANISSHTWTQCYQWQHTLSDSDSDMIWVLNSEPWLERCQRFLVHSSPRCEVGGQWVKMISQGRWFCTTPAVEQVTGLVWRRTEWDWRGRETGGTAPCPLTSALVTCQIFSWTVSHHQVQATRDIRTLFQF